MHILAALLTPARLMRWRGIDKRRIVAIRGEHICARNAEISGDTDWSIKHCNAKPAFARKVHCAISVSL